MAGPKTAAETEQEEGKSKLDISSDGGAPGSGKPPSSMQYSGKVQQKALTLIQGTLVQSDPAAPGIGANASAGEIATWIEDDGGLKGALRILRILPTSLEELRARPAVAERIGARNCTSGAVLREIMRLDTHFWARRAWVDFRKPSC